MKFANSKIFTNPGNPIHTIYSPVVDSKGSVKLKESGKENTDDYIQSFKESTDIAFILAKIAQGDTSVLNRSHAIFGDFTKAPKTYAEVLQLQIDAKKAYDGLSAEVKAKFGNDMNKFFASAGSYDWYDALGMIKPEEEEKEEVKSE